MKAIIFAAIILVMAVVSAVVVSGVTFDVSSFSTELQSMSRGTLVAICGILMAIGLLFSSRND